MRIAMLQLFNEKYWAGYAIDQAMKVCDKLLIVEGSNYSTFADVPEHSDDGTLDIISDKMKAYPNQIELLKILMTSMLVGKKYQSVEVGGGHLEEGYLKVSVQNTLSPTGQYEQELEPHRRPYLLAMKKLAQSLGHSSRLLSCKTS